ncbi:DUF2599 domain-containing protein [Cellulomonas sp.]|uniref:DUF2599 domain-containing protein n=1 Tax=Cellulomonas sp. TaxID=40001 RepID=UPI003BA94F43
MSGRGAAAGVLLALVLAGCTPSHAGPQPETSTPTPTLSPTPAADPDDPAVVRATGIPVPSGAVTLLVSAPALEVTTEADGSTRATAHGDALVAAPAGMSLTVLSDGSGVVRDGAGTFVAGFTAEPWAARLTQVGPEVARLAGAADDSGSAGIWFTAAAVVSAVWGEAEGGRSLAVTPSGWARTGSLAAQEGLWAQVVAQAPEADSPGMQAQLECHELGAPDKATWNLEPWRPDVSAVEMIRSRCNPS